MTASLSPGRLYAQPNLTAAIAGLQRRYAAVDCLSADFTQRYRGPGVDQTESGTLLMKKPGLMRWEYKTPETKLFVADGRETYLYTPADRQVFVQRFTAADLRSTPLQLLLGRGDIGRDFLVSWEPGANSGAGGPMRVRLTPRGPQSEYAYVVIEYDLSTYDIGYIVIRERTGNTSEFMFRNLKTDIKVDSRQFQFKIPKGVEVVRLDEK
jgi:outer membrane lipoprotein carrier protein